MNYQSNQKYTKYFYLFSTDKKILLFNEKFIGTLETPIKQKQTNNPPNF